ncbi:hypothetical protein F2P81_000008 [Scophthalmus maximus]|uniref:HAT C-terminal dimerisation domain-containing protein n=1 Tax=Scophthalmus maximus TaxID=52904 RepID=A0A6A4TM53_SCOMX|nr:hypothetical protein F2P81_000008 [Scophthalmus maximus]
MHCPSEAKLSVTSNTAQQNAAELQAQQAALGQQQEPLIQDVPTRWNSTVEMAKRLNRNQAAKKATLDQQHHKLVMLTPAEWNKLQRLETLLEPCREDLASRQEKTGIAWLKLATALDLCFKDLKSLPKSEREDAWTTLGGMLLEQSPRRSTQTSEDGPPKKKMSLLLQLGSDSDSDEEVQPGRDIHRYRAEPSISMEDCPLQWWSAHSGAHDKLALLARKYRATPASTVPCERLFSVAGHIVQKKRSALLSENVNQLVCLSNWLKE